jgi:Flp pilus assembly protein TadG
MSSTATEDQFLRYVHQSGDLLAREPTLTSSSITTILKRVGPDDRRVRSEQEPRNQCLQHRFKADNTPTLLWTRSAGGATLTADASGAAGMGLPADTVIRFEAKMSYSSPFNYVWSSTSRTLTSTAWFRPRETRAIAMDGAISEYDQNWDFIPPSDGHTVKATAMAIDRKRERASDPANRATGLFARLRAMRENRRGAMAVNFALLLIPLLASVGLSIDGSRFLLTRYHLQSAVDAAALAVATVYQDKPTLDALAGKFVTNNFSLADASLDTVSTAVTGDVITVDGSATMQTLFMSILQVSEVHVSVRTKVKRAGGGLLVSLVLDNTGSMWSGSKIASLRSASDILVDAIFDGEAEPADLRVSIVPYASTVNVVPSPTASSGRTATGCVPTTRTSGKAASGSAAAPTPSPTPVPTSRSGIRSSGSRRSTTITTLTTTRRSIRAAPTIPTVSPAPISAVRRRSCR